MSSPRSWEKLTLGPGGPPARAGGGLRARWLLLSEWPSLPLIYSSPLRDELRLSVNIYQHWRHRAANTHCYTAVYGRADRSLHCTLPHT